MKAIAMSGLCLQFLGCAWLTGWLGSNPKANYVFPRLDSASAQYFYAAKIDSNTISESRAKLEQIIAAYQQVLDHFAEDQLWTPLAFAQIADCYYRMREYPKAIEIFKRAQQLYPNYPFVHAQAEWRIGRSYESLGNHRQAKEHYKRCMDTFRHNKNAQIQVIVKAAEERWIRPAIPE